MIRPLVILLRLVRLAVVGLFLALAANGIHAQTVYTWNSGDIVTGTITPTGVTTLNAADTLNIETGSDHDFNARTVTNNGTVNWNAGNLRSGGGGSITNNFHWNDANNGYTINNAYGGTGGTTFTNAAGAIYTKSAGVTSFSIGFTNAGIVNVTGGTFDLAAGGTFSSGSVIGSSGSGVAQVSGGPLTMSGNITATRFVFAGGNLAGDQTFTGSTVTWQGSTWNSANTTTIAANSTLTIATGNNHDFQSHAIVNNGTINWTQGHLRAGSGGAITNNATWNDTSDGYTVNNDYGGTGGTQFINAAGGTYHKISGTTTFLVPFSNYGTLVAEGGILNLAAGGTFYDGSTVGSSGPGVAQLTGGVLSAGGTGGFTATNFLLTAGQLSGNMTFLGTTNWVGSDFNTAGTATIGATGVLNITTSNNHDFNSHAIVNNGTVNWSDGNLRAGSGGTITNNAAWNDTANSSAVNDDYGGAGGTTFINATTGVYTKSAGTTTFGTGVLVNNGTVSVTGGKLDLYGGTFNDNSSIGSSGTGVVELVGGVLNANGTIHVQNFLLNGGTLTGNQTIAGTLDWRTGDLNSVNTTTIANGSTLGISTSNNHDFNAHAIVNNGTVNWSDGNLRAGSGATITNNATWNDSGNNGALNNDYGGAGGTQFINTVGAFYNKTAGTTLLNNSVLVNNGTVSVTGGQLNLSGATLNAGSTTGSSGPGVVQFISGLLTANGTVNVQNFLFSGGELTGNQTLNGSFSWLGGDFNTPTSTTIGSGSTLTIDVANTHDFNAHAIVNNGTANWIYGVLRSGSGGTITNNAVWNDTNAGGAINNDYGGTGGTTFANAATGVYNKISGNTTISAALTNAGTINVNGGTLTVTGAFNNTGKVAVASGAIFGSSNALTFDAGSVLTGRGTFSSPLLTLSGSIDPGTLTTAGQLSVTGDLSLLASSQALFELGGTAQGSQYDFLSVSGNVSLGGNLGVRLINGFENGVNSSMTFTVLSANALLNSFSNVANGARVMSTDHLFTFMVNYGTGSPYGVNNVVLSNFAAVPEPSTWALLFSGATVLAVTGWRRRTRSRAS